ncbi:MAG TPA: glycine cleavage system protein H [Candidatus Acidoferrales bacterium]|nr:glycine cleavage system protein H [Candidatus Acidoferrales bacterium]
MFPWVFGFKWQTGNLIFLGIFYSVVTVIFSTLIIAARRAIKNIGGSRDFASISWYEDFSELPAPAKVCRHVISGELEKRICPNAFDCRVCELHPGLLLEKAIPNGHKREIRNSSILGLNMPADRLYHRGHTWVKKEHDGTLTVGLDDFASKIIGTPDIIEFPKVGTKLEVNGTGWFFEKGGTRVRVLSPVEGKVISTGNGENGFYIGVKPQNGIDLRHLLKGSEIGPWIMHEVERLETLLTIEKVGIIFADGGELENDLSKNYLEADWDKVLGEMFLES